MKKSLLFPLILMLTACATPVPVKQRWPDVPSVLMERCPPLKQIPVDRAGLRDMLITVIENYAVYYQCADRMHTWQEWYTQHQKIFQEVNQ